MTDRLLHELKLVWKTVIVVPIAVIVILGLFALVQYVLHQNIARTLLATLEMFLPLAAGIVGAAITARDSALELHLTMPSKYSTTSMLRLFIVFCWMACLALLCISGGLLFRMLAFPTFVQSWSPFVLLLTVQLLWMAPLAWFTTVGFFLAVLTQSRTASGTLLGIAWFLDTLFALTIANVPWLRPVLLFPATLIIYPATGTSQSDFNSYWLTTRFELLGTALVLFLVGWLLLHDTERLLKGATEE